jgi:DNA-binding NtrC family response regulator
MVVVRPGPLQKGRTGELPKRKRRPKALIVDDMRSVRETVCQILEEGGFETEQAHCTSAALELLGTSRYDLVVTDLKMPGGDGLGLLEEMKKRGIKCPVIVLTSFGSFCSRVKAIAKGAFMHIDKPFKADRLLTAAVKALDWKR